MKNAVAAETEAVAPGMRLRGLRGSGKVGVRYIPGTGGAGHATALVVATGSFQLIERDTSPHDILPRGLAAKTARGRGSGKRALAGASFGPVASAHSPGTKGKHPFEKGVEKAKPLVDGVLRRATVAAIAKELG